MPIMVCSVPFTHNRMLALTCSQNALSCPGDITGRLAAETLVSIFNLVLEDADLPLVLSHVCRRWRSICQGFPILWSIINSSQNIWAILHAFQCSSDVPLHITFNDTADRTRVQDLTRITHASRHRIESLVCDVDIPLTVLDGTPDKPIAFAQELEPWPQLRQLVVRECVHYDRQLMALLGTVQAHGLTDLEFSAESIDYGQVVVPLLGRNLQRLVLHRAHTPIHQLIESLKAVDHLRSLELLECRLGVDASSALPSKGLTLARLARLRLHLVPSDILGFLKALLCSHEGIKAQELHVYIWADEDGTNAVRTLPADDIGTRTLHEVLVHTLKYALLGQACTTVTLLGYLRLDHVASLELDPAFKRLSFNFVTRVAAALLANERVVSNVRKVEVGVPVPVQSTLLDGRWFYVSPGDALLQFRGLHGWIESDFLAQLFQSLLPDESVKHLLPLLTSIRLECLDIALKEHAVASIRNFLSRLDPKARPDEITFDVIVHVVGPRPPNAKNLWIARETEPDSEEDEEEGEDDNEDRDNASVLTTAGEDVPANMANLRIPGINVVTVYHGA